jgi:glyoxylase-like metal-dependent hydrolase (beta-lactamase superfamily II)/rhodanese-related sulfurtransferase
MYIEQLYTGCLSEAAYYIESNGEAAIIDPLRETAPYIEQAKSRNATIKYIFETHFHADFVSGHVDLAKKTGAQIIYGPTAQTNYEIISANDGDVFTVGKMKIKVLHTPGHTPESACYLLFDENGKEYALFSGDTLFIGDVGRPDLAIKSDLTQDDLAGMLFDSLRNKIMTLPDEVLVYPAHGAGSACGKNISSEKSSTIGDQKKFNYALQNMSKQEFIQQVTTGILPAPQYFQKNASINKNGYVSIEEVMSAGVNPMSSEEVEAAVKTGALILDTRKPADFGSGFIKGALNIGIDGQFAVWAGTLIIDIKRQIILITDKGREGEAVLRLARVGYDNTIGYLEGGVGAWKNSGRALETINSVSAVQLAELLKDKKLDVLDVRKPGEYSAEHLKGVPSCPLDFMNENIPTLDKNKTYYVHCKSGYRSMIAGSIFAAYGFNIVNVTDGYDALKNTSLPKVSENVVV